MSIADDGREPDPRRDRDGMSEAPGRPPHDPPEVTRRGPAGRRLVALIAGVALLVVVLVWLILYLTASETSDESTGAGRAPDTLSVVQ